MKLLIIDIDGVMTDGTKIYSENGVVGKRFNDKDFTAIKRFKKRGIEVVFLSGDTTINKKMANDRNIPFYVAGTGNGVLDKKYFLPTFQLYCPINEMAYIGDDYYDLDIILAIQDKAGFTFCPSDAAQIVQRHATVLNKKGGEGVIEELYEIFFPNDNELFKELR